VIRRTVRYMENVIHTNPTYDLSEEILAGCTNREDLCAFRAAIGGEHMMWLLIRDGGFTTFSSLVSSTPHSECEQYPTYMKTNCAPSCRTCGFITDPPLEPESPRFPDDFVHPCQDDEPRCPVWAREGECKANPGYMLQSCAGSCGICQLPPTRTRWWRALTNMTGATSGRRREGVENVRSTRFVSLATRFIISPLAYRSGMFIKHRCSFSLLPTT